MPDGFLRALESAATSPYAFVAYIIVVVAWTYIAVERLRLRQAANEMAGLSEADRWKALQRRYNVLPKSGLTAEQWMRSRVHTLVFLAFTALVVAGVVLFTVAMVQRTERLSDTTTDWQMFLNTEAVYASRPEATDSAGLIDSVLCGFQIDTATGRILESPPNKILHLPADQDITLIVSVKLIVDNVFSKYRGLIYPVGLTTTWDHTVYTLYDGMDAEKWRELYGPKLERSFQRVIPIHTPRPSSNHFILIMSGATLNAQQLFLASTDMEETANSIWNLPYSAFDTKACGGYLRHPFVHPGRRREHVEWPLIAIPVALN